MFGTIKKAIQERQERCECSEKEQAEAFHNYTNEQLIMFALATHFMYGMAEDEKLLIAELLRRCPLRRCPKEVA